MIKAINEFPGYSVSDEGWIESEYRFVERTTKGNTHTKMVRPRKLKSRYNSRGYGFVTLRRDGKTWSVAVHVMVAQYFVGPRPTGLVVHHKDNDKKNNAASNLEYVTKQKNSQEFFKTIGITFGSIPINEIPSIIDRINSGESSSVVAAEYGVTRNDICTISRVVEVGELELKK